MLVKKGQSPELKPTAPSASSTPVTGTSPKQPLVKSKKAKSLKLNKMKQKGGNNDYEYKYLKYKQKYLKLKNQ
jgi:hypothetical protein